jgi:predicted kinase
LFGDESVQGCWLKVWREVDREFREAVQAIASGTAREAIYDATNVVRKSRRQAIALARGCGFTYLTGIWLNEPLEVCLQRNQQRDRQVSDAVIERMNRRLWGAPPSIQEGFDCLIEIKSEPWKLFKVPD